MHDFDKEDFLSFLNTKTKLSKRSIRSYRIRVNVLVRWLKENELLLNNISVEKFVNSLVGKNLSNSTINTHIHALQYLERYCHDRGLESGFMNGIEAKPKEDPEIIFCTPEEIDSLLSTHNSYANRNGAICDDLDFIFLTMTEFIYQTGCRFDEASNLKLKRLDISAGKAYLIQTKNRDNRYVYFHGPFKDKLKKLVENKDFEEFVFTNSIGNKIQDYAFNTDLRRRAKKAGIKKYLKAHSLRHSCATHLLMSGVDLYYVKRILGHRDIKTTERYLHVADTVVQQASMRLPLLRKYIDPKEVISQINDFAKSFGVDSDNRFNYAYTGKKIEVDEVVPADGK